jgi:tripartite-type tricarboxylate transporter receptor subunit TctC
LKKSIQYLAAAIVSCFALGTFGAAQAQAWPNRPIRLVVPFAAAGAADLAARVLAQKLGNALGRPVVVENRGGAAGNIGTDNVAKSQPDGYSLLLTSLSPISIAPHLDKNLSFNPSRDLIPVSLVANVACVLVVNPAVPAKTVSELLTYSKVNPGKVFYGSSGTGDGSHLAGELFNSMTGTSIVHVPYKGGAPAMMDLMSGQIQLMFASMASAMPNIKSGKVRALAVTENKRSNLGPDLPTVSEAGVPGFEYISWLGIFVPAGTPPDIVARLSTELAKILQMPDVRERLLDAGLDPLSSTPNQFAAYIKTDSAKWARVIQEANVKTSD